MTIQKNPRQWKPGQSGNPNGRKPGSGKNAALRASIDLHLPDIISALAVMAKNGDAQAARLLLERTFPPVRPTEQPQAIDLPGISLADKANNVLDAVASGHVAPGDGSRLIAAIGTLAKVEELKEFSARVAALEAKL